MMADPADVLGGTFWVLCTPKHDSTAGCGQAAQPGRNKGIPITWQRWIQVTLTSVKAAESVGPISSWAPTQIWPQSTIPDTTEPTPLTSNVLSTCTAFPASPQARPSHTHTDTDKHTHAHTRSRAHAHARALHHLLQQL